MKMNSTDEYPLIGMSPGNSYFKDKEVTYLLSNLMQLYGRAAVFVPDIPAISTYLALGYPLSRAREKALSKGRNLRNRAKKCAQELGIPEEKVRIIDWDKEIKDTLGYLETYRQIEQLYFNNIEFQKAINNATSQVLLHAGIFFEDLDSSIKIGKDYLLSELAFLTTAPAFLKSEKVTLVYHNEWPVYTDYISGIYDKQPKDSLGFLLLSYEELAAI